MVTKKFVRNQKKGARLSKMLTKENIFSITAALRLKHLTNETDINLTKDTTKTKDMLSKTLYEIRK